MCMCVHGGGWQPWYPRLRRERRSASSAPQGEAKNAGGAERARGLIASVAMILRSTARTSRWLLAVGVLPALVTSCGGRANAPSVFGKLEGANEIFFAHETLPACALEASSGEAAPRAESQWVKVPPNALTNRRFSVVQRVSVREKSGGWMRVLALRESSGAAMWLRNAAVATPEEIEDRWSCVVPANEAQALSFDVQATAVQLIPHGARCHGLTPITGTREDVRFAPYALIARRLFVGADKKPVLGVTLASPGGERLLTLTAGDFQNCFGTVAPAADSVSPDETKTFLTWVTLPTPDAKPAPPVSFGVVLAATGLDQAGCIRDGSAGNVECRQPLFGVVAGEPGPYGAPRLVFTRQRLLVALHGAGDKLVSGGELLGETFIMRLPKVREGGAAFARYFNASLSEAVISPEKQTSRGARGARILRPQDAVPAGALLLRRH